MAFWSGERLEERLPEVFGSDFVRDKIDCSAYTLTVGGEAYITPDHKVPNPSRHTAVKLEKGDPIAIPAGQFGFLLTKESVLMPDDAMAFISMKSKLKFRGLINVSGFHVDPGFQGRLIFSVFNAGPKPLHIKSGDDLFLMWFADLDRVTERKKNSEPLESINSDLINGISGEIQSAHSLSERIAEIDKDINDKVEKLDKKVFKYSVLIGSLAGFLFSAGMIVLKDKVLNGFSDKSVTEQVDIKKDNDNARSEDKAN
ncbi:dCTP deaminase domain-containing protein [Marinobacterium arenosum]|uniref:dCTP deaminase domain-containing protein n=1 Tax=Marinobacterium arenosum TaxID=2862496 RepID=UPI001C944B62|nr:hypothetical protein [Marinobacterium arenosum]MBY4678089.1 hypothetical protein [Marinobacterium arenosum]